ncbi:MAG: hypothetical protein HYW65_04625 [Candidatus Liptonbacteria bacterium]|nr:hypothetical protein [Candidatus Liptonbacteria bacterium]
MKFTVNSLIFEKFPGLHIGVVVAKGVNNAGGALAEVETKLREEEIAAAVKELKELVKRYCGGVCIYAVLEKENPKMPI